MFHKWKIRILTHLHRLLAELVAWESLHRSPVGLWLNLWAHLHKEVVVEKANLWVAYLYVQCCALMEFLILLMKSRQILVLLVHFFLFS